MSESDFLHLDARLGEAAFCGPDLDTAGDDDHLNFLARVEGVLPASFAAFDRSQIDFSGEMKAASALLDRAIDLRVLVLLAKLTILDRRLADFAGVVAAMAVVLKQHWDGVHPSGDIELRRGVLMALDDMPHTVMPLQAVPLFESRNLGRVSFRHYLIASGAIVPRDNEESHQAVAIATALERADDAEIEASRSALARLAAGLSDMAAVFSQHLGAGHDLALPNLRKLVTDQRAWLDKEWVRRNPAQAGAVGAASGNGEPPSPGGAVPVAGSVASHEEARQALDAVAAYFARHEPSSLALLLVRQCRQLSHVSFLEAMRALVPDALPLANLRIGKGIGFTIPIDRFSAFETAGPEEDDMAAAVTDSEQETGAQSEPEDDADTRLQPDDDADGPASEETTDADAAEDADIADDAEITGDANSEVSEEDSADVSFGQTDSPSSTVRAPKVVRSQPEALAMMGEVASFYRGREPSSPLPLLLDRARSLAGQDFLAVLEAMLPAAHLNPPEDT